MNLSAKCIGNDRFVCFNARDRMPSLHFFHRAVSGGLVVGLYLVAFCGDAYGIDIYRLLKPYNTIEERKHDSTETSGEVKREGISK